MKAKRTSVFYRGRLRNRRHRLPFVDTLKRRAYSDACIMPKLNQNTNPHHLALQHVTGNRHNVSYYQYLADAKMAVTLHGGEPHGYQFWECSALKCAQVIQSPKPTECYHGRSCSTELLGYEEYDPLFERG